MEKCAGGRSLPVDAGVPRQTRALSAMRTAIARGQHVRLEAAGASGGLGRELHEMVDKILIEDGGNLRVFEFRELAEERRGFVDVNAHVLAFVL